MIAVAIVAIIAAIAYPSYQDHLRKGRRAAAQAFLIEVAAKQQQYLLDARRYAIGETAIATLNMTVPTTVSQFYTITVGPAVATVPPTYTLTATPITGSVQVKDGALTLTQDGTKTRGGNPGW